ncbi:uncharacterized protein LOC120357408 [Solenopsis invicta]|uniref:uncharacterized protein LOC120357408 n=1 Tax=Solenopsis invicta TaxID=13686 RepID=UPI00193E6723|nr:uncharacterized protein LOC120357408 [Solenopsis invicta]
MNDEKALTILEKYFVLLGGFNISNALDGFLKASVTDKLIKSSFTWKEGDKKIRFRETALSLKYYGALRKIENFKNISVKDYELEMSKIIKNVQQRHYMSEHRKEHGNVNALEKSRAENLLAAK